MQIVISYCNNRRKLLTYLRHNASLLIWLFADPDLEMYETNERVGKDYAEIEIREELQSLRNSRLFHQSEVKASKREHCQGKATPQEGSVHYQEGDEDVMMGSDESTRTEQSNVMVDEWQKHVEL